MPAWQHPRHCAAVGRGSAIDSADGRQLIGIEVNGEERRLRRATKVIARTLLDFLE